MTLLSIPGKRRQTFGFRFWHRGRLHQAKGFSSKTLAREAEKRERRRVEAAAWEARWGPLAPALTPWEAALARYREAKAGKATLEKDLARLGWWQGFLEARGCRELQGLTPDLVDAGKRELAGRAPQTIRHYLAALRHLCNLGIRRWRLLERNPVAAVELPKVVRVPPTLPQRPQLAALVAVAEPHLTPVILAALYTGLRQGALLRLTHEDFTARPGLVRCRDEKGGKVYWLPVARPLADLVRRRRMVEGPLFGLRRFPVKAWARARTAAGLPGLRFHDLRHLVGTTLSEAGIPLRVVQRWLGHSSVAVTERYTEPTDPALLEAASTLGRTFAMRKSAKERR